MPAIQAMRSDALALRAKEDMQEKIPQFYNSVNQSLGQSIVQGQDAAEQLIEARFEAANKIAAELRQKLDGKGGLTELGVGMTMKTISQVLSTTLTLLGKTSTTKILELASSLANFCWNSQLCVNNGMLLLQHTASGRSKQVILGMTLWA